MPRKKPLDPVVSGVEAGVASRCACVQCLDEVLLSFCVITNPHSPFVSKYSFLHGEVRLTLGIQGQLGQTLSCRCILLVTVLDCLEPNWLAHRDSSELFLIKVCAPRECVCGTVGQASFVLDSVLQSNQFCKCSLLDGRVESLVCQMEKAFLIRANDELCMLQVWAPMVDG